MQCVAPLTGHYKTRDDVITIPCGECVACKLNRRRSWAIRIMNEAQLHEDNSFITLTYDHAHLPDWGGLDKAAFPRFMKRLRKKIHYGTPGGQIGPSEHKPDVRYFMCAEYGTQLQRPHYHAILFGYAWPDKTPWTQRHGQSIWRSPLLETLWPFGLSEIGTVTPESAAYVAGYVLKKVNGPHAERKYTVGFDTDTGELGVVEPEYTTMSRRPGIGHGFALRYLEEIYQNDSVITDGHETKPPRYYDQLLARTDPLRAEEIRATRALHRNHQEEHPDRRAAQQTVLKSKLALNQRRFEA